MQTQKINHHMIKLCNIICRVGLEIPTVEVRYKNVCIEAECDVVQGEPLPTLWNTLKRITFVSAVPLSFFRVKSKYSIYHAVLLVNDQETACSLHA